MPNPVGTAGAAKKEIQPSLKAYDEEKGQYVLPVLPYKPEELEPHIDKMTMEIHHDRHHQGYVNNLNDAVKNTVYADYELYDIISRITTSDEDKKLRNNAGGHVNHTFFWKLMGPNAGGEPTGALADDIKATFGSFDEFKTKFQAAGVGRFGSGWAWLVVGKDGKLAITSTPNQDSPLMEGVKPVLGCDVWEHAYYLKYQNRRPDYLAAWWNVVNWAAVAENYATAKS